MTIAACYLSPEGVVLGADSTTSARITPGPGLTGFHYFNHNQKLFELGEDGTVGMLTWGLGGLDATSYRTLMALLADDLKKKAPTSLAGVADRWLELFWGEYEKSSGYKRCKDLGAKSPHGHPAAGGNPPERTSDEESEFEALKANLVVGFCIAGYWLPDRTPSGFEITFSPVSPKPAPRALLLNNAYAWGVPALFRRLILGIDDGAKAAILSSGKWNGTAADLDAILSQFSLGHAILPIRDAVDFVHSCIYSTIKAMKFSNLFQICGGPIELAVITSDRRFRWVQHKPWNSAIEEI